MRRAPVVSGAGIFPFLRERTMIAESRQPYPSRQHYASEVDIMRSVFCCSIILSGALFIAFGSIRCVAQGAKPSATAAEQKKTDDNTKPVEISSDVTLRSSVNDVVKAYNGVEADVKDGVVTLRGSLTQSDLQKLVMKVNELKPKKVETDKIVIKS